MAEFRFIEPLDVLYLRGNKLFDGAGAYSSAQMPPWPSLAAGALRSRMLVDHDVDLASFADEKCFSTASALSNVLGTPKNPGTFSIQWFGLAKRSKTGYDYFFQMPSDVVLKKEHTGQPKTHRLNPIVLHKAILSSAALRKAPVFSTPEPFKPYSGYWLKDAGLKHWVCDELLDPQHFVKITDLWKTESRLGIGMDADKRSNEEGQLYTSEVIALRDGVGFLTSVQGGGGLTPRDGLLRFGGDGRAAKVSEVIDTKLPEPDWDHIVETGRFKMLLTTPGLFEKGWLPDGIQLENEAYTLQGQAYSAELVSASVSRAETISGWDLAHKKPKPAQYVAPVGSVYWFENFKGDIEQLKRLLEAGLWTLAATIDKSRQAEGFNRILIGNWKDSE